MNFKSPRAPNPFRIEKLNTINGTIDSKVVYARLIARTLRMIVGAAAAVTGVLTDVRELV